MISWINENQLQIDDTHFFVTPFPGIDSTNDRFVVAKYPWMIEKYDTLFRSFRAERMFILGIYKGGCCALFQKLANPRTLIAIDINPEPVAALQQYIEMRDLGDVIKPHYGVDQADAASLQGIISSELSSNRLDFIVDDASHMLGKTRASFNALFPFVRPGGLYVIEDWSWAHVPVDQTTHVQGFYPKQKPLTILIFEILLACGSAPGLIGQVIVNENSAWITRGPREVDPLSFKISEQFHQRGRDLISALG